MKFNILEKTKEIMAQRNQEYGDIHTNFQEIANYWSIYKGVNISSEDVARMMALLKLARMKNEDKLNEDNTIDAIGYIKIAYDLKKGKADGK